MRTSDWSSDVCSSDLLIKDYQNQFLSFLENHDEERIASAGFAGNPLYAQPAMVVSATISGGPIMLYFGQDVGEPGKGRSEERREGKGWVSTGRSRWWQLH